jgi:hypothetical protein
VSGARRPRLEPRTAGANGTRRVRARLATAVRQLARRRHAAVPRVRVAEQGGEPRFLAADDPTAQALAAAAEALLSAAQHGSRR